MEVKETPLRISKKEVGTKLVIERRTYAKKYSLVLDRSRCKRCDLCKIVCYREAITLEVSSRPDSQVGGKHVSLDIDPEKCSFCGMCVCICPFSALTMLVNGETYVNVEKTESFPRLLKEIEVDAKNCDPHCTACMDWCPIKINPYLLKVGAKELCPCCGLCENVCPEGAIQVKRIFSGVIKINNEKCPEGCRECVDACPVSAMFLDANQKVQVNDVICIYCGACLYVCPSEGALEIYRTFIRHTPVKSGAWNKALEKLTSTSTLVKELWIKSSTKARERVSGRLA